MTVKKQEIAEIRRQIIKMIFTTDNLYLLRSIRDYARYLARVMRNK